MSKTLKARPTADRHPDARDVERLVAAAVAAPSMHNTQPWRFRYRPESRTVELRAALERALPVEDAAGRALHISAGAALLNLRLAVRVLGWEPVVRLLPHYSDPLLLAAVRLGGLVPPRPTAEEAALHEAIWRRHSSRTPFTDDPLPPELCTSLAYAAHVEGAELRFPDFDESRRLLSLTAEGEDRNQTDAARLHESRAWIREQGDTPYGIPPEALGNVDHYARVPLRDFTGVGPAGHPPALPFEPHPHLAVLTTAGDRPADWLRAGQALERVLLEATVAGVRSSLLHQAIEWPDLRWMLRNPRSGPGHVQMLIRLGYGPEGARSPRASVAEALDS